MLSQITGPVGHPVSTDDAKAQLRVLHADEDTHIDMLIAAAHQHLDGARGILGRSLMTQTWRLTLSGFEPCGILLPCPPVQSVISVAYYDSDDVLQTMPTADWRRVGDGVEPASSWPTGLADRSDAVRIDYVAGYGDAAAVPGPLKAAMLSIIAELYDNRSSMDDGGDMKISPITKMLIAPFRVPRL